ncbi:hypothetical protein GCM10011374_34960 [Kocuria dechangensis]|uniref:Multidrug DMT transporter permease n=1 Tax=Kocuria dechangensis TaxID=1176249 RepID=A0A917H4V6_9MICC|nr:multidrug DMT transporter permease [Kocuria dechangensis]GGG67651.1 hypothetical protein GCM10011374_34960 [Kocuria dechangensis]
MIMASGVPVLAEGHWVGIPIAVAGAVMLSLGTWFQSRGVVAAVAGSGSLNGQHLGVLIRRPVWAAGTAMLGVAIMLQLAALRFSPLMVVQPIGAVALVVTEVIHLAVSGRRPGARRVVAVVLCVGGIAAFVVIAALWVVDVPITDEYLRTVLLLLALVLVAVAAAFRWARQHLNAIAYTVGAGVLYGFVATLAKTVLGRVVQGQFGWLSLTALAGLLLATAVGAWLVQHAHTAGRPELVVAGLTVVDPLIAVTLAITVLGEAATAPPAAFMGFLLTGALAVTGVMALTTAGTASPTPEQGPLSGPLPPGR